MLQSLIVALIVAAALLHFSTRYLPAGLRKRIVAGLVRCGANDEMMSRLFKIAPGCGSGCGSCGSCDTEPPKPGAGGDGGPSKRVITLHVQR
ncbi:DUF6587 family protein [Janthinobacterium agaricidamnosum]|uniref:Uncharacterized protein n=1 Tax=Janthinobacterium agaricidamnosum NBRC 102515 = DSM 9628 TaxID=1349767 RepID=W0UX06_9BURK|nr:DUF6587 family protein [Janthinobacterium agaricidamnosum]CDG81009.1 hypothetical protein GJA_348 [Janthinobacterium agaricidamnosum NBRC 102515 = DSM 9628]